MAESTQLALPGFLEDKLTNRHYLKQRSSFIVVVLRSLRHGACVNCGIPLNSLKEATDHWLKELGRGYEQTDKG